METVGVVGPMIATLTAATVRVASEDVCFVVAGNT